jgi:hypothetical protein
VAPSQAQEILSLHHDPSTGSGQAHGEHDFILFLLDNSSEVYPSKRVTLAKYKNPNLVNILTRPGFSMDFQILFSELHTICMVSQGILPHMPR